MATDVELKLLKREPKEGLSWKLVLKQGSGLRLTV
jgi:hypothetical protein